MGQTASSSHSRGNIPRQMHPGRCPLLTTPTRGCQGSRARDSTHLVCPWASTTRSVNLQHLFLLSIQHSLEPYICAWEYKEIYQTVISFYFPHSKSHSMVRTPTSLEVDTPTAKAVGYVFISYPARKSSFSTITCLDLCARCERVMYVK